MQIDYVDLEQSIYDMEEGNRPIASEPENRVYKMISNAGVVVFGVGYFIFILAQAIY